jgi:hypothetical protein
MIEVFIATTCPQCDNPMQQRLHSLGDESRPHVY